MRDSPRYVAVSDCGGQTPIKVFHLQHTCLGFEFETFDINNGLNMSKTIGHTTDEFKTLILNPPLRSEGSFGGVLPIVSGG